MTAAKNPGKKASSGEAKPEERDQDSGEALAKDDSDEDVAAASDERESSAARRVVERAKNGATEEPTIWQRATYRWTAITTVMAALLILYTQHPYYKNNGQFAPWRSLYPVAFVMWLALGIPYCKATLEKFSGTRYAMRDGGLHLIILGRAIWRIEGLKQFFRGVAWVVGWLALWEAGFWLGARLGPSSSLTATLNHDYALFIRAVVGFALGIIAIVTTRASFGEARRFWNLVKRPRIRTTLLGICVKGFFTPLMTGFVSGHFGNIGDAWLRHKNLPPMRFVASGMPWHVVQAWWEQVGSRLHQFIPSGADLAWLLSPWSWNRGDWNWALGLGYDVVFFIDCLFALIGYSTESRWMGNKTRSVEPTALGWACCLACYPPYNNVLGTYLPLDGGPAHITDEWWLLFIRGVIVFLFAIYASATVAFGFKFSNLTNRGIVSRGPYRFVRHPAYLCKCTAWWLENLANLSLQRAFFLTLLCGVYALRAYTEERHLGRDPEYQAYKKKTPWVIFPGIY